MDGPITDIHQFQPEAANLPPPLETYIPKGYPKLLFSGTSVENSESDKKIGLRLGSLRTSPAHCLDDRFYRGRMIISRYNPLKLETEGSLYQQYIIKENTGEKVTFKYNAIDTDGAPVEKETQSSRHIPVSELASVELSQPQRRYLGLVSHFISGYLCGVDNSEDMAKVAQLYKQEGLEFKWDQEGQYPFPDRGTITRFWNGNYDQGEHACFSYTNDFVPRKAMADLLNLDVASFNNPATLREALSTIGNEEDLMKFLSDKFPSTVKFDWNNLPIDSNQLVETMIEQIYQSQVVSTTKNLHQHGIDETNKRIFLPGPSTEGLKKLRNEKHLRPANIGA